MTTRPWSRPSEIRAHVQRLWDRGVLLSAPWADEALFPLIIPLKKPSSADLSRRFEEVRAWIAELEAASREEVGHGYSIEWRSVRHRTLGANRVPQRIVVPTPADAMRLIRKTKASERFHALAEETVARFPSLRSRLVARPHELLKHADDWHRVLSVLDWFVANPRPGLYLRQLEIPGVDTKFIESRVPLFLALLDLVLPDGAIDADAGGKKGFARRYGLLDRPQIVRVRSLDPRITFGGLRDIAARPEELTQLSLPIARVVITENEINGLAFPDVDDAVVFFGLGYGVEMLRGIEWLRDKEIRYWGDIDTHGFAILDRVRAMFPQTRSFLMDRETLLAHRQLWVEERSQFRCLDDLVHLDDVEWELFDDLRHDRLGQRVRLEQERVDFGLVKGRAPGIRG